MNMHEFIMDIFSLLSDLGYLGIALGLMIEVIPSEIVLSYGGYLVAKGEITFTGAVIAGVIGGTIAQWFLYWLGYYGGRTAVLKFGKYILIKEKHLDMSEKWFAKYGTGVVFTARFIPVVRHAISIPAGMAKMSFAKFTMYTAIAAVPWSILFLYLGLKLGENWGKIDDIAGPYMQPIIISAILLAAVYFVISKKMNKKKQMNKDA
jgi:membrane protein DedA with SNARE-associated domain